MGGKMWDKPRDPARIPRVLEKVALLWGTSPDLRLGQLIVNLSDRSDPFSMEDDRLEAAIDAELEKKTRP